MLADIDDYFATEAEANPAFAGKTFAGVWDGDGFVYVYTAADSRIEVLTELGLEVAPSVSELDTSDGGFFYELSYEQLDQLEADFIVSYHADEAEAKAFLSKPELQAIPAVAAGDVAQVWDPVTVSSVSPPTALSVQWSGGMPALDRGHLGRRRRLIARSAGPTRARRPLVRSASGTPPGAQVAAGLEPRLDLEAVLQRIAPGDEVEQREEHAVLLPLRLVHGLVLEHRLAGVGAGEMARPTHDPPRPYVHFGMPVKTMSPCRRSTRPVLQRNPQMKPTRVAHQYPARLMCESVSRTCRALPSRSMPGRTGAPTLTRRPRPRPTPRPRHPSPDRRTVARSGLRRRRPSRPSASSRRSHASLTVGKAGTACQSRSTGTSPTIAIVAACSSSATSWPTKVAPMTVPACASTTIRAWPS